jgi:acetyl/propionyl-CoA carboxylase alpha subunit
MRGHAIEARLYAEDPRQGFLPSAGRLHRFQIPELPGVRVDAAIGASAVVSPYYDPLVAKMIAHAPTRAEAARKLSDALRRAQIHGLRTNRELLVRVLEHAEFLEGRTDTHFLVRHDPAALAAPLADRAAERLHAAAAALSAQAERRRDARVLAGAPSGWRNNPSQRQTVRFRAGDAEIAVEYHFSRGRLQLSVDGHQQPGVRYAGSPEQVRLEIDGVERAYQVHRVGETFYVDSALGSSVLVEVPRFGVLEEEAAAGSLVAPLPGVVNEVKVKQGDTVRAGDVLVVIESMKVFHWISAPLAGRVAEIRVAPGHQVDGGTVLAVIEESA